MSKEVMAKLRYMSYLYGALIDENGPFDEGKFYEAAGDLVVHDCKQIFGGGITSVFKDRATSRVSDVSSVMYRDIFLWMLFYATYPSSIRIEDTGYRQLVVVHEAISNLKGVQSSKPEGVFIEIDLIHGWGEI